MQVGDLIMYPILNHFGADLFDPVPCDCLSSIGYSDVCNAFLFDLSFVFYDYTDTVGDDYGSYTSDDDMTALINYYNNSAAQLTTLAFNASIDAIQRNKNDSQWRRDAYSFCSSSGGLAVSRGCSILSLFAGDHVVTSVSEYYYQVRLRTCIVSLTTTFGLACSLLACHSHPDL